MDNEQIIKELTETEQRARSNTRRIDRLEERLDKLETVSVTVAAMQTKITQIENDVGEIKTDVKSLMEKPSKWWEKLIAALLTAAAGYIVGLLMRGGV